MIGLIVTAAALVGGFVASRDFVRRRLRYVDAVKKPAVPLLAGAAAAVVAWPAATAGYTLQENSDLANTNWMNVTNEIGTMDSNSQVIITPSASQKSKPALRR